MDSLQTSLIRLLNPRLTFLLLESHPVRVAGTPASNLVGPIIVLYNFRSLFTNQNLNLKWKLISVALVYAFI